MITNDRKTKTKFDFRIGLLFIPAAYFSYLFHEFGHWIIGVIQGHQMNFSLNGVWTDSGQIISETDRLFGLIGGPAFTIIQAFAFLILIKFNQNKFLYPFLIFPLISRGFSLILGEFKLQDEAIISEILGIWTYSIAIIVLLILLVLVWKGSRILKIKILEIWGYVFFGLIAKLMVIGTWEFILK